MVRRYVAREVATTFVVLHCVTQAEDLIAAAPAVGIASIGDAEQNTLAVLVCGNEAFRLSCLAPACRQPAGATGWHTEATPLSERLCG